MKKNAFLVLCSLSLLGGGCQSVAPTEVKAKPVIQKEPFYYGFGVPNGQKEQYSGVLPAYIVFGQRNPAIVYPTK